MATEKKSPIRDTNSHKHFAWLIESRAANQRSALLSQDAFRQDQRTQRAPSKSPALLAASFSLWRAAFLAEKAGLREAVLSGAAEFLEKISPATDRVASEPK